MICILRFGIVFVFDLVLCELFFSFYNVRSCLLLFYDLYVVRINFAVVISVQLAVCVFVFI